MKKRNQRGSGLRLPYPTKIYTDDPRYEYLARLAFSRFGKVNLQGMIEEKAFAPGWQGRLEGLRRAQRTAGIEDTTFWHPKRLHELGIERKRGRRSVAAA